jgi:hypothetical protein
MRSSLWNENWQGKPKYSKKTLRSATNFTWPWTWPPRWEVSDSLPELWHARTFCTPISQLLVFKLDGHAQWKDRRWNVDAMANYEIQAIYTVSEPVQYACDIHCPPYTPWLHYYYMCMVKSTSYETHHYALFSNLPPLHLSSIPIFPSAPCSQTPSVYIPPLFPYLPQLKRISSIVQ